MGYPPGPPRDCPGINCAPVRNCCPGLSKGTSTCANLLTISSNNPSNNVYSALMDRVEGKDANNILQSYTDIMPGRPTSVEHRHPEDDLRNHYDRRTADPLTKMNALTLVAGENQTRDY